MFFKSFSQLLGVTLLLIHEYHIISIYPLEIYSCMFSTISDVLQEAKHLMDSVKPALVAHASQDIVVYDPAEKHFSLFMDGFGEMYQKDENIHKKVDDLFTSSFPYTPQ